MCVRSQILGMMEMHVIGLLWTLCFPFAAISTSIFAILSVLACFSFLSLSFLSCLLSLSLVLPCVLLLSFSFCLCFLFPAIFFALCCFLALSLLFLVSSSLYSFPCFLFLALSFPCVLASFSLLALSLRSACISFSFYDETRLCKAHYPHPGEVIYLTYLFFSTVKHDCAKHEPAPGRCGLPNLPNFSLVFDDFLSVVFYFSACFSRFCFTSVSSCFLFS